MLSGWWVDFLLSAISRTGVPYLPLSQCPPCPQPWRSHLSPLGAVGGEWVCPILWCFLAGGQCGAGSFSSDPFCCYQPFLYFLLECHAVISPPGRLDLCRFSLMRGCLPRSALVSVYPQLWQEGVWAGSLAPLVLQPMPRSVRLLLDAQGGDT